MRRFPLVLAASLLAAPVAQAQYSLIGPSKCVGCHDHERQAQHWQKDEPAAFKGKAHFNTLKQLDSPKAAGFAKAIGLADPYDVKGACVKCHATVFRGDANAGVSCESCHGAASGFLELHQTVGSYAKAIAAGMRDLRGKPAAIVRVCIECHAPTDRRLAAAGHPSGDSFDAGVGLQKLVHWKAGYDFARLAAEGRAAMGGRASKPAAASPVTAAPAAAPNATPAAAPATARPAPASPTSIAAPADPWDWDKPVRPLPADYVPEPVAPAPTPGAPAAAGSAAGPGAPKPPRPTPAKAPALPPSIAEETALPPSLPDAPASASLAPAIERAAPAQAAPAAARPAQAEAAELRGQAAALLDRMLRSGARAPQLPPPTRPAEFRGPDSELLRLQDEVLALAFEALRRPEK